MRNDHWLHDLENDLERVSLPDEIYHDNETLQMMKEFYEKEVKNDVICKEKGFEPVIKKLIDSAIFLDKDKKIERKYILEMSAREWLKKFADYISKDEENEYKKILIHFSWWHRYMEHSNPVRLFHEFIEWLENNEEKISY